jgi:hypothetical protein
MFADYHYYGVGDRGGAPKESDVNNYTQCVRTAPAITKYFLLRQTSFTKIFAGGFARNCRFYKANSAIEHSAAR